MKSNKLINFFAILVICLSIGSIVYATTYSINGAYFAQGKSHQIEGELGTTVITWTKANELVGTPTINIKCQAKVGLFYSAGASANKTISSTGTIYVASFEKDSSGVARVTWKQTNDNASMSAYLEAH